MFRFVLSGQLRYWLSEVLRYVGCCILERINWHVRARQDMNLACSEIVDHTPLKHEQNAAIICRIGSTETHIE